MPNADLEMTINPWRQKSVLVLRNVSWWGKMQLLFGLPYRISGSMEVDSFAIPKPVGETILLQIEVRFNGYQDSDCPCNQSVAFPAWVGENVEQTET